MRIISKLLNNNAFRICNKDGEKVKGFPFRRGDKQSMTSAHSTRTTFGAFPTRTPSSLKNLHTGGVTRSMKDVMERAHWKNSAYVISPL